MDSFKNLFRLTNIAHAVELPILCHAAEILYWKLTLILSFSTFSPSAIKYLNKCLRITLLLTVRILLLY